MGQTSSSLGLFSDQSTDAGENSTNESSMTASKDDDCNAEFSRIGLMCGSIGDTIDGVTNARTACIHLPKESSSAEDEQNLRDSNGKLKSSTASMVLARALLNATSSGNVNASDGVAMVYPNSPVGNKAPSSSNKSNVSPSPMRTPVKSRNKEASFKVSGIPSSNNATLSQSHIHPLSEQRAQLSSSRTAARPISNTITIGLSLSRRHSVVGHPDTVTRQTAFDFNELQDRAYKFVSSTDCSGWRAGGGESGKVANNDQVDSTIPHKVAAPDTVHIPIIQINCEDSFALDRIISAIARGEVFIPQMSIMPESLSVNGVSPPDLVVRFGCERNDDVSPDQWPNWCLEFIHNQIYELFCNQGAIWSKRPFQLVLAKKVRWKTVKHMNQFFAHSENVINAWREKGAQNLDPQLSYIEGGATPEEVGKPHGIYLLRDGHPTNYFPPNLQPPYSSKMNRNLLLNVLNKSWDRKKRDWSNEGSHGISLALDLANPGGIFNGMCGMHDNTVASPTHATSLRSSNPAIIEKYESMQAYTIPTQKQNSATSNTETLNFINNTIENEGKIEDVTSDDNSDHVNLVQSPPESEAGVSHVSDSYDLKIQKIVQEPYIENGNTSLTLADDSDENDNLDPKESKALIVPSECTDSKWSNKSSSKSTGIDSSVGESSTTVGTSNMEKIKMKAIENARKHSSYNERKNRHEKQAQLDSFRDKQRSPKPQIAKPMHLKSNQEKGTKKWSPMPTFEMDDKLQVNKTGPIKQSFSQASMEYSVDSNPSKGGGATDKSVSNGSIFSFATQQTKREGGDVENVPKDEDLRAVGWAKAFDPSSQSYYYYTLDRSKTSWDNPLEQKAEI